MLLLVPLAPATQRGFFRFSRYVAAFYIHEARPAPPLPLRRAAPPLHLPSPACHRPTAALARAQVLLIVVPLCSIVSSAFSERLVQNVSFCPDPCVKVLLHPHWGYFMLIPPIIVFLLSGFDGSPTHAFLYARIYPENAPHRACWLPGSECRSPRHRVAPKPNIINQ